MKHETSESIDLLQFGYERGLHERATLQAGCGYDSLLASLMWVYVTMLIVAAAFLFGRHVQTEKLGWPWSPRKDVYRRVSPVDSVREEMGPAVSRTENAEEEFCDEVPSRMPGISRAPSEGNTVATEGRHSEISTDALIDEMQAGLRPRTATSRASSAAR